MKYDLISKAYIRLLESPAMDDSIDKHSFDAEQITLFKLKQNHVNAKSLGNSFYHQHDDNDHDFYHLDNNGNIDCRSNIVDNVQLLLKKRNNVPSHIPMQLFTHALNHLGKIESDVVHTEGSRKFWQKLPNIFPKANFSIKDTHTGKETPITHNDLIDKQNDIWDSPNSYKKSIIITL